MKKVIITIVFFLLPAHQALAAPPVIQHTQVATSTTGYNFSTIDYDQPTDIDGLIDLSSNDFINQTGSMAITVVTIVSEQAGLSIYMLLLLSVLTVVFLFTWLYNRRVDAQSVPVDADTDTNTNHGRPNRGNYRNNRIGGLKRLK